jgi:hypothetical protein
MFDCRLYAPRERRRLYGLCGLVVALAAFVFGGCGPGDEHRPPYTGVEGQPVTLELVSDVPAVEATVEPAGPDGLQASGLWMIDTGSPITLLDTDDPEASVFTADTLDVFELSFRDYTLLTLDVFAPGYALGDTSIIGIVGGDLLRYFCPEIDYRNKRATLHESCQVPPSPRPDCDATVTIPFALLGGGQLTLSNQTAIAVKPTRIAFEVTVEDTAVTAVLDSGASAPALTPALAEQLFADRPNRPHLEPVQVATVAGVVSATMLRVREIRAGGVAVRSVPCLAPEDPMFLQYLSAEIGRPVSLLLGGAFLREFNVRLDYAKRSIYFAPYVERDHIDPDEYVFVGVALAEDAGQVVISNVYNETDAAAQDVQIGDIVMAVDGRTVFGLQDTLDAIATFEQGERVALELQRLGVTHTVELLIEDLLPHFYE